MKTFLTVLGAFALALSAWAATASDLPIFNGVFTIGADSRFVLVAPDGKASQWLKIGESYAGYTVKSYDAKESSLQVEKGSQTTKLLLDSGKGVQAGAGGTAALTPGTLDAANDLMKTMRFEEMMQKMMDQQKQAMGPMLDNMMKQMGAQMSAEDRAAFVEFQQKMIGNMLDSVMGPDLAADMAKAYSETFTQDQLQNLATFYSTPTGRALIDKTPEISAKLQTKMTDKMMQGMGKMQAETQQFMRDRARQKAAAAGAAPAPAAP